jgi:hypothetical protein
MLPNSNMLVETCIARKHTCLQEISGDLQRSAGYEIWRTRARLKEIDATLWRIKISMRRIAAEAGHGNGRTRSCLTPAWWQFTKTRSYSRVSV